MMHMFISYASKDGTDAARALVRALEAAGRPCWIGLRDVKAGAAYPGQIVSAIRASRGLVLLLTPGANESHDVLQEVQIAQKERKLIVPLVVHGTEPCDDLRYFLGVRQQISWINAETTAVVLGDVFAPVEGGARRAGRAGLASGESFRDGPDCPEMVVIPRGSFLMGSHDSEPGRNVDEGPVREVTIAYWLAVARHPVTRGEWRRYLAETGHTGSRNAYGINAKTGNWQREEEYCWSSPGFPQHDGHPVVCVSWDEALEYSTWLTRKTGHHYRLLSEAEYEYVNRAGKRTAYWWGDSSEEQWRYANGADAALKAEHNYVRTYCTGNDGFVYTSPVGQYPANPFGLRDTTGNACCWTKDRWHDNYRGAPDDGSAWESGADSARVVRGGSWYNRPSNLRSAARLRLDGGSSLVGFRLAMTV